MNLKSLIRIHQRNLANPPRREEKVLVTSVRFKPEVGDRVWLIPNGGFIDTRK
jgi:hypothetical protein